MSKFTFFDELNETRIFKRLELLRGTDSKDIALMLVNMILSLIFIYKEDESMARKYISMILRDPQFTGFKTTQPDLYNAIVLLLRQEKYADKVKTDYSMTLPEFRIKRFLRYLNVGNFDKDEMYQLLTILYREIKGITSDHERMRRQLFVYDKMSKQDKVRNLRYLLLQFRTGKARYSDIYPMLERIYKRNI